MGADMDETKPNVVKLIVIHTPQQHSRQTRRRGSRDEGKPSLPSPSKAKSQNLPGYHNSQDMQRKKKAVALAR
ncbi:unnamed protein product [Dovyalis caffra]|uniref:Uncharacterized protein n=1 Tax=Dovyalis caffra TaxID=77055 RepID=A0AAV1S1A1_9ROSI|nr:unnamed protein product [Dovyalis caffra]